MVEAESPPASLPSSVISASSKSPLDARRIESVRAGDPTPTDLRVADGRIVRSQCNVLPSGGRMLTYTDVTDLVLHAEELERLATTDGMTGLYNRRHFIRSAKRNGPGSSATIDRSPC
jgi:hypothetical protein